MNDRYAAKIPRPEGASELDPLLIPHNSALTLFLMVKWTTGRKYTGLAGASMWCTVKSDLSVVDASGELDLVKGGTPDPFTVEDAAKGYLWCIIPGAQISANLVIDTLYYIGVQIKDATLAEPFTVLFDTIMPYQQVTKDVT